MSRPSRRQGKPRVKAFSVGEQLLLARSICARVLRVLLPPRREELTLDRDHAPVNGAEETNHAPLDAEFIAAANAHNEDVERYLDGQQVRRETLDLVISV